MNKNIDKYFSILSQLCSIAAFCLIIIHCIFLIFIFKFGITDLNGWDYIFHLDGEINIPSLFSSIIISFSAWLMFNIRNIINDTRQKTFWTYLSFFFAYMALDEFFFFHERLIMPLRTYFDLTGYFFFSWVLVGAFVVTVVLILSLRVLHELPKTFSTRLVAAGAIYILGAIGVEMIGANEAFLSGYIYGWQPTIERGLTYAIIVTIEESLEIIAIVYLIRILTRYYTSLQYP